MVITNKQNHKSKTKREARIEHKATQPKLLFWNLGSLNRDGTSQGRWPHTHHLVPCFLPQEIGKRAAQVLRLACPGWTPGSLHSSRMTAPCPPTRVSADLAPHHGVACGCTYFPPQKILVVMTRLDRLWSKRRRAVPGCNPLGSSLPDPPHSAAAPLQQPPHPPTGTFLSFSPRLPSDARLLSSSIAQRPSQTPPASRVCQGPHPDQVRWF